MRDLPRLGRGLESPVGARSPGAHGTGAAALSVSRTIHRERVLLAGWGRAILLQLAHPMVARGVAQHSAFTTEPWGWARRLQRTLHAMLALSFGSEAEAADAAARINAIHDRVHGELPGPAGVFAAGWYSVGRTIVSVDKVITKIVGGWQILPRPLDTAASQTWWSALWTAPPQAQQRRLPGLPVYGNDKILDTPNSPETMGWLDLNQNGLRETVKPEFSREGGR